MLTQTRRLVFDTRASADLAWGDANDPLRSSLLSMIEASRNASSSRSATRLLLVEPQPSVYAELAALSAPFAGVETRHAAACGSDANVTMYRLQGHSARGRDVVPFGQSQLTSMSRERLEHWIRGSGNLVTIEEFKVPCLRASRHCYVSTGSRRGGCSR